MGNINLRGVTLKIALIMANKIKQGYPPLGILYIASYLRKYKPEYNINVYDTFPDETFSPNEYDIIGLSCMSIQYPDACDFSKSIRKEFKGCIIFGGVHTTLTKQIPDYIDFGIIGEGEQTFLELANFIADGSSGIPKDICGLVINHNKNFLITPKREPIADLDSIPFPAWDLIDMEYYLKPNNVYGTVVGVGLSLMTSRGCCYSCKFCSSVKMWDNLRFHSAEYVVNMIEYVTNTYNIEYIWCADDHFALNKKRLNEIANLIKKRNIKIGIGISCRVDSYNDNMKTLLKQIGVKALALGLETGSNKILKEIKSGCKLSVNEEAQIVRQMVSDGFQVHGMFIINTPNETLEDLNQTIDFIHSLPLCKVSVAVATPYYGTEWWDTARQQGIVGDNPNDHDLLRAFNMKTLAESRVIFDTGIPRDVLVKKYYELADYSKSLFYFDWKNR